MYQPAHGPLQGRHILVVEDDPFIALALQRALEAAGATVIGPAHDLSEAMSLIERSTISAAILDYRLQVGNTLPLARLLAGRDIPFLFQTSDPLSVAREHPDATAIPKPFPDDQLMSAVQALLVGR